MSKSLYVGNLPWSATEADVRDLFSAHGEVLSVKLITDRETGRARGFGFVEMEDETEGMNAINALNETEFQGRMIVVKKARPREEGDRNGGHRSFHRNGENRGERRFNQNY